MLTFSRNKLVGIERSGKNSLLAHGVLDDNIYGMEIDVEVQLPHFEITHIQGRMKRYTTSECPKAVPKLESAIGMRLTQDDFATKVNKLVGREGCRHFANLLLECCDAIIQTAIYSEWETIKDTGAGANKDEFLAKRLEDMPVLREKCMAFSSIGTES